MKKKIMIIVAMLIALPLNLAYAVEVFQTKTELKLWKPDKAYNGYTIFCPMNPRATAPIFSRTRGCSGRRRIHWETENPHCFCSISICFVIRVAFCA